MKAKKKIFLLIIILISGCTTAKLDVKNEIPENLGIYIINSGNIDENDLARFFETTNKFIDNFNKENHRISLYLSDIDSNSIVIDFYSNRYVTPANQVLGAVITTLGLATLAATLAEPDFGFYLVFWYIPKVETITDVYLTEDIDFKTKKIPRSFVSRHSFQNIELQKEKQQFAYYDFLSAIMFDISNRYYLYDK